MEVQPAGPLLQAAEGILKTYARATRNKCFVALYSFHRSQQGSLLTAFHLRQTAVDECNFARPQKRANLEVHCGAMPFIVWDQIGYLQVTCINIITSGTGTRDSRLSPSPAAGQRALCAGCPKPHGDRHQHLKWHIYTFVIERCFCG